MLSQTLLVMTSYANTQMLTIFGSSTPRSKSWTVLAAASSSPVWAASSPTSTRTNAPKPLKRTSSLAAMTWLRSHGDWML